MKPFCPSKGANQDVLPAAVSASVETDKHAESVRLVNSGANICYVRIGPSPQIASIADTPIRPNSEVILRKGDGEDTVAYISAAGTALHIQPGNGGV